MLETALFSIAPSDDLEFFLESSDGVIESSTLYFTRPSKLHYGVDNILLGSIEVIQGRIEDGLDDLLFESVRLEVDILGGYQSDPFEDDIFGFSVKTNKDGVESSVSYSLISTGFNYCIQLKFLSGFTEEDVLEISNAIIDGIFRSYDGKAHFGDVLHIQLKDSQLTSKAFTRFVLHSAN
jgi:hypothetical protein